MAHASEVQPDCYALGVDDFAIFADCGNCFIRGSFIGEDVAS